MKKITYILTLFLSLLALELNASPVKYSVIPEDAVEGIYQVSYSFFKRDVMVYLSGDSLFVPLSSVLSQLKIYYEYDSEYQVVKGFLLNRDSAFKIDFPNKQMNMKKREYSFSAADYFISEMEIYVKPRLIAELFGITIYTYNNHLMVLVQSEFDLPVLAEYKRKMKYKYLGGPEEKYDLPLLYGRGFTWINGAMIDYNINAFKYSDMQGGTFFARTGMMMLGGDLQIDNSGIYVPETKFFSHSYSLRQRWYFGDNPYLTQLYVGDFFNVGQRTANLPSKPLRGVQISNETTRRPMLFDTYILRDRCEPGWQVELYINNQLIDQEIADANGDFSFSIPISYGNTNIELRYYGQKGEFISKRDVYKVPSEYLIPGEFKYNLSYGESRLDRSMLGDAKLALGITSWMSASFDVEKIFSRKVHYIDEKDLNLYGRLGLKISNHLLSSFNAQIGKFYSGNLLYNSFSSFSMNINFGLFDPNSNYYQAGKRSILGGGFSLSRPMQLPFSLSGNVVRNQNSNYSTTNFSANMFLNLLGLNFITRYSGNLVEVFDGENRFSQSVGTQLSFSWNRKPSWLRFLKSTRLSLGTSYNITEKRQTQVNAGLNQSLFSWATFNVSANYNLINKLNTYTIGLNMNMPLVDSRTTARFIGDESVYNQELSGIIGLNPGEFEMTMNNPVGATGVGFGAVQVKFFLDENENGEFDDWETEIPNVRFYIEGATMEKTSPGKVPQRAYNIPAYTKLNVMVDKSSFKNPLWTPVHERFAFITEPNGFKNINVPCYTAGVVEGNVFRNNGIHTSGLAGVKIHIMRKDSSYSEEIPVFNDGSFYKMGVPPGEYIAYVDSMQCALLKVQPDNRTFAFNIKKSAEGDFVSGINFELRTQEYLAGNVKPQSKTENKLKENFKNKLQEMSKPADAASSQAMPAKNPIPKDTIEEPDLADQVSKSIDNKAIFEPKNIKEIQFAGTSETSVPKNYLEYLNGLVDYLKKNPGLNLALIGHTDPAGDMTNNMNVSVRRAQSIANYLMSKGITKNRLLVSGKGALEPKVENYTPAGRRQNRRVELKIVK